MDGTGTLFAPLQAAFDSRVETRVVRYPDRPGGYEEHCDAVRRALPADRPFVLLGESFSGPVAIEIAAAAPPRMCGMITCASFVTCPNPLLSTFHFLATFASPKLVPGFIAQHFLLGRFATPGLVAAHENALRQVSARTLAARLRAIAEVDVRAQLQKVRLPALYIRATEDLLVPRRAGDEFLTQAPQTKLAEIVGPHFLLQSNPRESAACIQNFMAALGEP